MPAVSSTNSVPTGFCSQKLGDLSSWHWNPGLGAWCEAGTLLPRYPSQIFIHHTWIWDQPIPHLSPPPTSLDGCGFFNSIIVRLLFNSISPSSVWSLFYILVIIFMWLCKEVSPVYLCPHLNRKPHDSVLNHFYQPKFPSSHLQTIPTPTFSPRQTLICFLPL